MARTGGIPGEDVEILVHVAAPSTLADDAVYRQLARAYLAFQPDVTVKRFSKEEAVDRQDGDKDVCYLQEQHHHHHHKHEDEERAVRDGGMLPPDGLFGSEPESHDWSFQSALDNRSSPPLGAVQTAPVANILPSSWPSSWQALPSEIEDSYPLPGTGMIHATPTRVLQRYLEHQGVCASTSPPSSPPVGAPREKNLPPPSSYGYMDGADIPSSIPVPIELEKARPLWLRREDDRVIPVTPAAVGGASRKRPAPAGEPDEQTPREQQKQEHNAEIGFDTTHISNSFVSTASPIPVVLPAAPPTRQPEPSASAPPRKTLKRIHHQQDITSTAAPAAATPNTATTVVPPSPPPSIRTLSPSQLIPPELEKLSRDLSSRYNPLPHRPLDPFERGHWLVDCSRWADGNRRETWVFLTNYLRSGLAGWGIWCSRDEASEGARLKLYCWGHVVKHMYLLLYLASGREVKYTGAEWRDGEGVVVVEVKGVGGRRRFLAGDS
ncbi:hypothetical protein E4U57_003788 [Claviceps arundinis]|uniref:Uncharacterized protein n=1 Tax=Claviceps arundinis TaxID=1623583 RepID=A0ABQ7P698_9HYPO|nr:hypothetical protein E4U57_003788 [Claviceps arundinis]